MIKALNLASNLSIGNKDARDDTNTETSQQHQFDSAVLQLCLTIIQHKITSGRAFDLVMVSFTAVSAWNASAQTWIKTGSHTSLLSQLTYDYQIFLLTSCLSQVDSMEADNLTDTLRKTSDLWLLNDRVRSQSF